MRRPVAAPASCPRPRILPLALLAAALLVPARAAVAASYWVGNGGNPPCTHATLQDAMNAAVGAAGDDLIYLVGPGPFTGPFLAFGGGYELIGNVASCGSTLSVGYATVHASGERPLTLSVLGAQTVRLRHLVVTTDETGHVGDGGAIHFSGASPASRLELVDTRLVDNLVADGIGGGVFVTGGRLSLLAGSLVSGNSANAGGGIAAAGDAIVELDGATVTGNTAFFDGGGIHTQTGATVVIGSSGPQPTAVADNVAARFGGGLYLRDEGENRISSSPGMPVVAVRGNQAQRGGGLYVDGSFVRLDYATVDHNQATIEGGGFYLIADGTMVASSADEPEPTRGGYPRIESNAAPDAAVMHVDDGAVVMASGRIRDHHAGAGSDGLIRLLSGILFLHGVAFDSNEAPALFSILDATMLQLEHASFAANTVGGFVRWRGSSSEVILTSSAFDETEPLFASFQSPSTTPQIACVTSRFASLFAVVPPGTDLSWVTIANPQFVAPPADLHLRHSSPAIDSCPPNERFDLDGEPRSHDDPYHANPEGWTADAGADEASVIFLDSVEIGDLGMWSSVHP
jgi:hypothetical protein